MFFVACVKPGQLQKLIDLDSNGERNALSSHYDETDEYINQMTSKSTATATVAHQPESESTLSNAKTVGATNNSEKSKQGNILNFSAVQNLNWNVIFLLGGGFALSKVRLRSNSFSFLFRKFIFPNN